MKVIKQKSIKEAREEKATVPEMERAITNLEIESYQKDIMIAGLENTIAEDERAITELEIEVEKLKGNM